MPTPRAFGQSGRQSGKLEAKDSGMPQSKTGSTPQWLSCMQRTPRHGVGFQCAGTRSREDDLAPGAHFDFKEMEAYIKDIHWVSEKTLTMLHETSERSFALLEGMQLESEMRSKVFAAPAAQQGIPPGLQDIIALSVQEAVARENATLQEWLKHHEDMDLKAIMETSRELQLTIKESMMNQGIQLKQQESADMKSMEQQLQATIMETAEKQRKDLETNTLAAISQGPPQASQHASAAGIAYAGVEAVKIDEINYKIDRMLHEALPKLDSICRNWSMVTGSNSLTATHAELAFDHLEGHGEDAAPPMPPKSNEASQWRQSKERNINRAVADSLDSTAMVEPGAAEEKAQSGDSAIPSVTAIAGPKPLCPITRDADGGANDAQLHEFKRQRMQNDEQDYLDDQAARGSGAVSKPPKLREDSSFAAVFVNDTDLGKPIYDVELHYKSDGCAQYLAKHPRFSTFGGFMIVLNAVYMGIDSDYNKVDNLYDADLFFIIGENVFCVWFTLEWLIRLFAFENKHIAYHDGWMRFDGALVSMMVVETWILMPVLKFVGGAVSLPVGPLRLLRLLKLTRMARMMNAFPELITMVKGVARSIRAISGTFLLVVLLLYTFAILIHMLLKDDKPMNTLLKENVDFEFTTMPHAMWCLFMCGVFMLDGAANLATYLIFSEKFNSVLAGCCFLLFTLLAAMTVLQMLIGVLCEVVSDTNKEHEAAKVVTIMKQQLVDKLRAFDDGDGKINQAELAEIMRDPDCKALLRSLRINRLFLLEMQRLMFPTPDSSVAFKPLTEMMLMCRGDNSATVETMASGFSYLVSEVREAEQRTIQRLAKLESHVRT